MKSFFDFTFGMKWNLSLACCWGVLWSFHLRVWPDAEGSGLITRVGLEWMIPVSAYIWFFFVSYPDLLCRLAQQWDLIWNGHQASPRGRQRKWLWCSYVHPKTNATCFTSPPCQVCSGRSWISRSILSIVCSSIILYRILGHHQLCRPTTFAQYSVCVYRFCIKLFKG